jgi:hypothetical protein
MSPELSLILACITLTNALDKLLNEQYLSRLKFSYITNTTDHIHKDIKI